MFNQFDQNKSVRETLAEKMAAPSWVGWGFSSVHRDVVWFLADLWEQKV